MLVCTFKLNITMIIKRTLQNLNKQNETILSDRKLFMPGINNIINEKLQKMLLKGILDARTICTKFNFLYSEAAREHKRL